MIMLSSSSSSFFLLLIIIFQFENKMINACEQGVTCGCSNNSQLYSKIVGGQNARAGTWTWIVGIRVRNRFYCAGSILSDRWILTAAHCFSFIDDFETNIIRINPSDITIHAGSINLREETQLRRVSKVVLHPNFDEATFNNDIALLQLSSSFDMMDENLAKICVPSVSRNEFPPVNALIVAVGWGRLWQDGPQTSVLQQTILQIINHRDSSCSSLINNHTKQFCAGTENSTKDTCQGDSGGPLMLFTSSQQWVLVGVTSFGRGCAQPGYAGVYTRTSAYIDWINLYVNNINSSIYPDSLIPLTPYDDENLQWKNNAFLCHSTSIDFFAILSIVIVEYLLN